MENATRLCSVCGSSDMPARRNAVVCSSECRYKRYQVQRRVDPQSRWSALHRAVHERDHAAVLVEIKARSKLSENGCWEWLGSTRAGYGTVFVGGPQMVHRLSLEAKCERPLGDQAAHHMCANPSCVNPDHLQPVTASENNAEMLARTYLVRRIRKLEAALAELDPSHGLLEEVGITTG